MYLLYWQVYKNTADGETENSLCHCFLSGRFKTHGCRFIIGNKLAGYFPVPCAGQFYGRNGGVSYHSIGGRNAYLG